MSCKGIMECFKIYYRIIGRGCYDSLFLVEKRETFNKQGGLMRKIINDFLYNYSIKKKLSILFVVCLIIPVLLTDISLFYIIAQNERQKSEVEVKEAIKAVSRQLNTYFDNASKAVDTIYINRNINGLLVHDHDSYPNFYNAYDNIFNNGFLSLQVSRDFQKFILYTDNKTIINGGSVRFLSGIKNHPPYKEFHKLNRQKALFFNFDDNITIQAEKNIVLVSKMNFFDKNSPNIIYLYLKYTTLNDAIKSIIGEHNIVITDDYHRVLFSRNPSALSQDFSIKNNWGDFEEECQFENITFHVIGEYPNLDVILAVFENWKLFLIIVLINLTLPIILMAGTHYSTTSRINRLSNTFKSTDSTDFEPVEDVRGSDEIANLMKRYNRMVDRTNNLIETLYKSRIRESESSLARKNAELLALHSQINPHFLFNALESIRMQALIKDDVITANMVEKLALLQRQYMLWDEDIYDFSKEVELARVYLELQKYRFGDRLKYNFDIDEDLRDFRIPKLSLITFVENACVHGIEKNVQGGWIFVRAYKKNKKIIIEIEDTGCGIEESRLLDLNQKLEKVHIDMLKDKHIGIFNAYLRFLLIYADKVEISIESEEQVGTTIILMIADDNERVVC